MKKCVLLSIRPQWCELIANGKKNIEVRKSRPKLETPFKCYIYCTQDKKHTLFKDWIDPPFVVKKYNIMNGKGVKNVFADNRPWGNANGKVIGEFVCDEITTDLRGENTDILCNSGCLTLDELKKYGGNNPLYGWHISALQIYGKPKELGDFYKSIMPTELRYEDDAIKRPPQSWAYMEEYDEKR